MAEPETKIISFKQAFSNFQGELKPFEQTSVVDFTAPGGRNINFTYTPLGKIMGILYPLFSKHNLYVRWFINTNQSNGGKGIECLVGHISTENEISSGIIDLTNTKDMKELAAQITYIRRYTLGLVLGLSTEEDKDAALFEESKEQTEKFAFNQMKKSIESTNKKESIIKNKTFLESELYIAELIEKGEMPEEGIEVLDTNGEKTKRRVPTLGLTAQKYRSLLEIANKKASELKDETEKNGA